jgi:hypothetical protein
MTLDHLTEQTQREQELRHRADAALRRGQITPAEHEFFLKQELGKLPQQPPAPPVHHAYAKRTSHAEHRRRTVMKMAAVFAALAVMTMALFALSKMSGNAGQTGLITLDEEGADIVPTQNGTAEVNATNSPNNTRFGLVGGNETRRKVEKE